MKSTKEQQRRQQWQDMADKFEEDKYTWLERAKVEKDKAGCLKNARACSRLASLCRDFVYET